MENDFAIWGWYHHLIGYPDLMGKTACYQCRVHERLGFQVLIKAFGDLVWINIPRRDFVWAEDEKA